MAFGNLTQLHPINLTTRAGLFGFWQYVLKCLTLPTLMIFSHFQGPAMSKEHDTHQPHVYVHTVCLQLGIKLSFTSKYRSLLYNSVECRNVF